ncbi:MAG: OmpA family protein [Pseudomonadota bacterium]
MTRTFPLFILLLLASHAWAEDCPKAIVLYNRATVENDLAVRERCFKKAIALCSDPEVLSRVFNNLADTYERAGRLSPALTYYRNALEAKPDLATSYFSVGDIFFRLKDYYSAAVMYGKGLSYSPEDEESRKNKKVAETRARRYMIIYFDFNSFTIPDRYLKRLDVVGEVIKEYGSDSFLEIMVTGHTCSMGASEYNRQLSLRRAQAVTRYLNDRLSKPSPVVKVVGKGEDAPLLSGMDKNASVLNRRVEVILRDKENLQ